jgi:hypothetical protein
MGQMRLSAKGIFMTALNRERKIWKLSSRAWALVSNTMSALA